MSATVASRRIVRTMPWQGRNQAIVAAREAAPRLPPDWGSSFVQRPPGAGQRQAPARVEAVEDLPHAATRRLYALLGTWAEAGCALPPLAEIGRELGGRNAHAVFHDFAALELRGVIRQWNGTRSAWRGQRVVRIVATGQVLRTAGAPAHVEVD